MKIPLGTAVDYTPVCLDTTQAVIGLVGDPGAGATTTCRYLTRWWTAAGRPATIYSPRRYEYADLAATTTAAETIPVAGDGLVVVDGADTVHPDTLAAVLTAGHRLVVLASYGPAACRAAGAGPLRTCYGLHRAGTPRVPLQLRLDWPPEILDVWPDERGGIDRPRHRLACLTDAEGAA